jgi:hypothetical protein
VRVLPLVGIKALEKYEIKPIIISVGITEYHSQYLLGTTVVTNMVDIKTTFIKTKIGIKYIDKNNKFKK